MKTILKVVSLDDDGTPMGEVEFPDSILGLLSFKCEHCGEWTHRKLEPREENQNE